MLRPFVHPVTCCCMSFGVVAQNSSGQTFEPTNRHISLSCDQRGVAQQCWIRLHSSSNISLRGRHLKGKGKGVLGERTARAEAPLLGPRTRITHGFQGLLDYILLTTHCRSQHCWDLSHPFAHHCQH